MSGSRPVDNGTPGPQCWTESDATNCEVHVRIPLPTLPDARKLVSLEGLSLAYLFAPYLIFWFGWLPLAAALVLGAVGCASYLYAMDSNESESCAARLGIPAILLAVAWVALSGVTPLGYANSDWNKHHAILKDLILRPWPVAYGEPGLPGGIPPLVYYIGYYLPAALVGKIGGTGAAAGALALWQFCGVLLAFSWMQRLAGARAVLVLALFVVGSGLDTLGWLSSGWLDRMGIPGIDISHLSGYRQFIDHREWWLGTWQYSSNTCMLFWTPQHALPAWILTGMMLWQGHVRKDIRNTGFFIAVCTLWSPLSALGLLPWAAYVVLKNRFRAVWTVQNTVGALLIGGPASLYLLANQGEVPHGFVWNIERTLNATQLLGRLSIFHLSEWVLIGFLCIPLFLAATRAGRFTLILTGVLLLLFPAYVVGLGNDFVTRVSLPTLFVFWMAVAIAVAGTPSPLFEVPAEPRHPLRTGAAWALVVFLFFAGTSGAESVRAVQFRSFSPTLETAETLPQFYGVYPSLAIQYLGNNDRLFFRIFGKTPQASQLVTMK